MAKPPYDPDALPPDLRNLIPENYRRPTSVSSNSYSALSANIHPSSKQPDAVTPLRQTKQVSPKSYAQVASSVAPQVAPMVSPNSAAGQSPRPHDREMWVSYGIKLKTGELSILRNKAKGLGLTVNAYIAAGTSLTASILRPSRRRMNPNGLKRRFPPSSVRTCLMQRPS